MKSNRFPEKGAGTIVSLPKLSIAAGAAFLMRQR
jgi:hypothetical protein